MRLNEVLAVLVLRFAILLLLYDNPGTSELKARRWKYLGQVWSPKMGRLRALHYALILMPEAYNIECLVASTPHALITTAGLNCP